VTFASGAVANARQISDVPRWALVRTTNCHVSPAPLTPVTVFPAVTSSAATNASSSSLPVDVEKALVVTVLSVVDG
jgi:hypothetical protein